jgi:hypothetical protein
MDNVMKHDYARRIGERWSHILAMEYIDPVYCQPERKAQQNPGHSLAGEDISERYIALMKEAVKFLALFCEIENVIVLFVDFEKIFCNIERIGTGTLRHACYCVKIYTDSHYI